MIEAWLLKAWLLTVHLHADDWTAASLAWTSSLNSKCSEAPFTDPPALQSAIQTLDSLSCPSCLWPTIPTSISGNSTNKLLHPKPNSVLPRRTKALPLPLGYI